METKEIVIPDGWEVKEVVGNKIVIKEKEKEFPKTWEKCYMMVEAKYLSHYRHELAVPVELVESTYALCQLLICRNAWWKQLEWKPNWEDVTQSKSCIYPRGGKLQRGMFHDQNIILAFPKDEVRNQFLETFRDLIEEAKELL